ncbi:MAG: phosphate uptake regulator, PhoU [Aigarchaeota archaeon]|nr:phosphate uptake regulator, PhoU [Aigarchaeota archaeon]MCX8192330.1 phosphate uptake regulator, PhoU [Nitrososphaeria archaeon]MDW7986854.1 PhoU domain-containing protein [Nitrososphaerota archaeon]
MSRILDVGLQLLSKRVEEMFNMGIESFNKSIEGILKYRDVDKELYDSAKKLRDLYEEINDIAAELIARYQPVAKDLRYILSCINISYGVLRLGRYAFEIARSSQMLGSLLECDLTPISEAGDIIGQMLKNSLQAFQKLDIEMARQVKKMDEKIDEIYRERLRAITLERDGSRECDVAIVLTLRNLERIADHATYICDAVEYIVSGHVRHR